MTRIDPSTGKRPAGFISLRRKFVLFLSLIIIVTCSGLAGYFIQNQRTAATNQLMGLGTILANNLAHNGRYGLITGDPVLLERLVDAALDVDEVVYVLIVGPDGRRLAASSKGQLTDVVQLSRTVGDPLFPPPASTRAALDGQAGTLQVTLFSGLGEERLYDFAVSVGRKRTENALAGPLVLESAEAPGVSELTTGTPSQSLGVVQVGLTDAKRKQHMRDLIRTIALITLVIIAIGILATTALASRIITPIKSLAAVAQRVAEGDLTASVKPTTNDEVGNLTANFNQMTKSLRDRDQAISDQLNIIRTQVRRLTSLNQTGSAITSTLDIDKLLDLVLQQCVDNVGFSRMLLALYDPDRHVAHGLRAVGVPDEIEHAVRRMEIPVQDNDGTDAELLIRGKPLLVRKLEEVASKLYPPVLDLCRKAGVISFIAVPLKSKDRMLGFVCGDFGDRICSQEDLDLLVTIASHIAVAIDNARAYQALEHLTQTLELRVEERTHELQQANERLVELDELRAAFVSIVSHELRTPMTSIKGYVENMLDGLTGPLTERQSYYLTRVKFNVERLTRLLNELLFFRQLEDGRVELHVAPLSMPELTQDVVEGLQTIAQKKSLALTTQISGDIPAVQGDRDKLYRVLTNLVGNAIKYTPQGGHIQVEIEKPAGEESVQVCISDTGCGIGPDEIEKVFERFYRAAGASQDAGGFGLGLPITKGLVELHGGKIWVESTPGVGSRFYFRIPIAGPPPKSEPQPYVA